MNALMNKLQAINYWFDRLPEPTRFLLFLSVVTLATLPMQLGVLFKYKWLVSIGLVTLCFLCSLAVLRVSNSKRSYAVSMTMLIVGLLSAIALLAQF